MDRIGRYRIVDKLGEGGMGAVYEAIDDDLKRRVAIKVLHPSYTADPGIRRRFLNEARAGNIMSHPGVVQVSEVGELEGGGAYLVMELLRGESLQARLQRSGGGLSGRAALRVARQIAAVMVAAHDRGIVHRDLKPANVMIVPDPEAPGGERAKILDFGIAKLSMPEMPLDSMATRSGVIMGTPMYMSPEQCLGRTGTDGKTDVYALGAMLYEMLAGRPPFLGETMGELMLMHMQQRPPPLRLLEPAVSTEVSDLAQAMLGKDPAVRPTMAQVAAVLDGLAGPSLAEQRPRTTLSGAVAEAVPMVPRRRRRALAAACLVLALLGAGALQGRRTRQSAPAPAAPPVPAAVVAEPAKTAPVPPSGAQGVSVRPAAGPPPPTRRLVRWSIRTIPTGAAVLMAPGAIRIGTTPYEQQEPQGLGTLDVSLQLRGYLPRRVRLDRAADSVFLETLSRARQPGAPMAQPRPPRPATGPEEIPFRD